MREVAEIVVKGVALGSIYAIVALGFVMVYRTTNVLNFAHGTLGALGGLVMASLVNDGGLGIGALAGANPLTDHADGVWGWAINLVMAAALAAVAAVVVERVAIRPLIGRSAFALLLATVGISVALQVGINQAPVARSLRVPWGNDQWDVAGVVVDQSSLAATVMAGLALGLVAAFNRTRYGLAARAVASDPEAAQVQGIDIGRIYSTTWALAAALAAVAAVAFSLSPRGTGAISTAATPGLFFRALPVIAIGGWDSYTGAYLGGLAIGLIQVGAGWLLSGQVDTLGPGFPTIIPYVLMIVVLLARPAGLFGQLTVRRV